VIPVVSGEAQPAHASSLANAGIGSPLARLLHALNQPLTGLQCSMEVALASPRTLEQYAEGLREGLELTARMRALVEAIREVTDGDEENADEPEATDLKTVLREVANDLGPVAEAHGVGITLECSADRSLRVRVGRRRLTSLIFRTLEAAQSLADQGSGLQIETGGGGGFAGERVWLRISWQGVAWSSECSRPELGLLVAQAGWERRDAEWERERTGNREMVTVSLPGISVSSGNS
jgi:C4-dicarboxylate-specific signal transduction histidine kinase